MQTRRKWSDAFEGLKEKYCHHRILYPAKIFQKPKWNKKVRYPRLFLASRPTTQERKFREQEQRDSDTFTHHTRSVHSPTVPDFQRLKRLPPMWETQVQSLGREDPLEKEMVTHSSILAWRIPWTEKPGRLQSMGSQRVGHDWVTSLSFTFCHCVVLS